MGVQSVKGIRADLSSLLQHKGKRDGFSAIRQGTDVNALDAQGRSPMRLALEIGDANLFHILVDAKASIIPALAQGQSALHFAVLEGHYALAKYILRTQNTSRVMKNAQDAQGQTPLHVAVTQGNAELVALLLKYNCNSSIPDASGHTAKDLALFSDAPLALEIIEQLSIEDVMQKSPQSTKSKTQAQSLPDLEKPQLSFSFRNSPLPNEPHSKGGSSHGSKSTLRSHLSEMPQVGDVEPVVCEEATSAPDLDAEILQSCIPVIIGSDLHFEELINRGSSCEVLKGKWRGCEVAIKKFKEEYKQNKKELRKFIKEMQTLAQVRHPNLILLMGICIDLPNLCLVTEYVPNMSLFYALHSTSYTENKSYKLTLQDRFKVGIQICKGLAYLHACDPPIVHRDLKPENCLLDFSLNIKIADFGLARPLTCFSVEEALTTTCIGTTRFMAPELFEKEKTSCLGVEVDIWALGCVLIELFSNKRPWDYISSSNASCIFYEVRVSPDLQKEAGAHP